jgi:hypothetical protein
MHRHQTSAACKLVRQAYRATSPKKSPPIIEGLCGANTSRRGRSKGFLERSESTLDGKPFDMSQLAAKKAMPSRNPRL